MSWYGRKRTTSPTGCHSAVFSGATSAACSPESAFGSVATGADLISSSFQARLALWHFEVHDRVTFSSMLPEPPPCSACVSTLTAPALATFGWKNREPTDHPISTLSSRDAAKRLEISSRQSREVSKSKSPIDAPRDCISCAERTAER